MDTIENRTFDMIQIGDSARLRRRLTMEDIKLFAVISGDANPAHVDEDYARSSRFHEIIAHGMWGGALISAVLGMQLPGPGTIYLGQSLRFLRLVHIGDLLTVRTAA
jgi:acyl dehydratase